MYKTANRMINYKMLSKRKNKVQIRRIFGSLFNGKYRHRCRRYDVRI